MLEYVHSRVIAAVGRFTSRIREVRVQIGDVNGPKGGLDKRCVILTTVRGCGAGSGEVIARHGDADFYAAIDGAAHSLKHLVARRVHRGHTKRHGRD
jgi:ribosome-associated translation inhibitor RaiA